MQSGPSSVHPASGGSNYELPGDKMSHTFAIRTVRLNHFYDSPCGHPPNRLDGFSDCGQPDEIQSFEDPV